MLDTSTHQRQPPETSDRNGLSTDALAHFTALNPPQPRIAVLKYLKDQSTRAYTPFKLTASSSVVTAESVSRLVAEKQQQRQQRQLGDPDRRKDAFALILHTEQEEKQGRKENSSPRKRELGSTTPLGEGGGRKKVSLVKAMRPRMSSSLLPGGGGMDSDNSMVVKEAGNDRKRGSSPILVSRRAAEREKAEEEELGTALEEPELAVERVEDKKRKRDGTVPEKKKKKALRTVPVVEVVVQRTATKPKSKAKSNSNREGKGQLGTDEMEELQDRLDARKQRRRAKALIVKDRTQSSKAVGKEAASKVKASSSRKKKSRDHDEEEDDFSEDEEEEPRKKRKTTTLEETNRILQEGGKAKNVRESRLTLPSAPRLGLFNKGVASGRTKVLKQLPDLAFSELAFLNAPRNAKAFNSKRPSKAFDNPSSFSSSESAELEPKRLSKSKTIPESTSHSRIPQVTYGSKGKHPQKGTSSSSRHRTTAVLDSQSGSSSSSMSDEQSLPPLPLLLPTTKKASSSKRPTPIIKIKSPTKKMKKDTQQERPSKRKDLLPSSSPPPQVKNQRPKKSEHLPLPDGSEASMHSAYSRLARRRQEGDWKGKGKEPREPSPVVEEQEKEQEDDRGVSLCEELEEEAVVDTRTLWKSTTAGGVAPRPRPPSRSSSRVASRRGQLSSASRDHSLLQQSRAGNSLVVSQGQDAWGYFQPVPEVDDSMIWSAGDMNRIREEEASAAGRAREEEEERGGNSSVDRILVELEKEGAISGRSESISVGRGGENFSSGKEGDGYLRQVEEDGEEYGADAYGVGLEKGEMEMEGRRGGGDSTFFLDQPHRHLPPPQSQYWRTRTIEGDHINHRPLFRDPNPNPPQPSTNSFTPSSVSSPNFGRPSSPFTRPFTDQRREGKSREWTEPAASAVGIGRPFTLGNGGRLGGGLSVEESAAMRSHWYRAIP